MTIDSIRFHLRSKMIEVEIKVEVKNREKLEQILFESGFTKGELIREEDLYFDTIEDSIRKNDHALRIRCCEDYTAENSISYLTHKGPKMDQISMTRAEHEVEISDAVTTIQILNSLGYTKQYPVIKHRQYFHKDSMTICIDQVENLGNFLEVEMIVENASEKEKALEDILKFLEMLGYSKDMLLRKSYLVMLQE